MSVAKLQETQNKIVIPLYSVEDETMADGTAVSSYGELFSGKGQQLINCWAETRSDPITGSKDVWVQKRTGINTNLDDASLNTNWDTVFDNWNGVAANYPLQRTPKDFLNISIIDDWMVAAVIHADGSALQSNATLKIIFFQPSDGTMVAHEITSYNFAGSTPSFGFHANSQVFLNEFASGYSPFLGSAPALVPYVTISWTKADRSASACFYSAFSGGTWAAPTQITTTDFATHYGGAPWTSVKVTVGNFAMLNGRAYIMTDDGYIWGSEIGDITTGSGWVDQTGNPMFENAISYPDKGVGLFRYKHHILAFGRQSLEFYTDVGAEYGLNIESTNEAFVKFGAVNPRTIMNYEDTIFFIGMSAEGGMNGLWRLEGYQPVRVSNAEFENMYRAASNNDYTDNVYEAMSLLPIEMGGRLHIGIQLGWQYNLSYPHWQMSALAGASSNVNDSFFTGVGDADWVTGVGRKPPTKPFPTNGNMIQMFNANDKTIWFMLHHSLTSTAGAAPAGALRAVNLSTDDTQTPSNPVTSGRRQYLIDASASSIWRVADASLATFASSTASDMRFMDNDDDGAAPASNYQFFTCFITSPIIDFETNDRKFCARASLIGSKMYPIVGWNNKGVHDGDTTYPENYLVIPYSGTIDLFEELQNHYASYVDLNLDSTIAAQVGAIGPWYSSDYVADFRGTGLPFAGDAHTTMLAFAWSDNEFTTGSDLTMRGQSAYQNMYEDTGTSHYTIAADDMVLRAVWGGMRCRQINPWQSANYSFHGLGSFRRRQFFWAIHCLGDFRAKGMELFITSGNK